MGAVDESCATVTLTSTSSLLVCGFTTSFIVITSALSITGDKSAVLIRAILSLIASEFNNLGLSFKEKIRDHRDVDLYKIFYDPIKCTLSKLHFAGLVHTPSHAR